VWLLAQPRILGMAFKPVSFWWAHRADGSLAAVVAEVHNTFGERHSYVLDGAAIEAGREVQAAKQLHVSPFCRVEGGYRFRVRRGADAVHVAIDHDDGRGTVLRTGLGLRLQPLTDQGARRVASRAPWAGLAVITRIHWQALRLWLGRVPVFAHPA